MSTTTLLKRWKYRLVEPHYPELGLEINSDAIRLAAVSERRDGIHVQHLDLEPLPPGSVQITPFEGNVKSPEVVTKAFRNLWTRNPFKSSKICLLIQDRSALTFHVNLEQSSSSKQETMDLIRFKLKKNVPFRIEEAEISYFDPGGIPQYDLHNLWVTVINHSVLKQFEQLIRESIQAECGLIDLTTFNLMNLADHEIRKENLQSEDHLYINLNYDYISIAITRQNQLALFRSRELERRNGHFREALDEIYPTTLFYEDKLGGQKLSRTFVFAPDGAEKFVETLHHELDLNPVFLTAENHVKNRPSVNAFETSRADVENTINSFSPLLATLISRKVEFL